MFQDLSSLFSSAIIYFLLATTSTTRRITHLIFLNAASIVFPAVSFAMPCHVILCQAISSGVAIFLGVLVLPFLDIREVLSSLLGCQ